MSFLKTFSIIFTLLFIASCGGDKKGSATPPSSPQNAPYSPFNNSLIQNGTFEEFKALVIAGNFAVQNGNQETYFLKKAAPASQNCQTFLSFFNFCTSTSSSTTEFITRSSTKSDVIVHEWGNSRAALLSKFAEKVNSAINPYKYTNSFWTFTSGGIVYGFDLTYPLAANPVYSLESSGHGYIFYGFQAY